MKKLIYSVLFSLACIFSLQAKNTALLIGIGDYVPENTGWNKIHGNNDVDLLKKKLQEKGFEVTTLKDSQATKKNITQALKNLVASTNGGDVVYLHFSGHGQLVKDYNNDEDSDFDQSFICYDACRNTNYSINGRSYKGQNHLIDDELFPYLNNLKKKVGTNGEVIVIFDSCYSGGGERGNEKDDLGEDSPVEWIDTTRGSSDAFLVNRKAENYLRKVRKPGDFTSGGGRILVISACESDKRNFECKDKRSGKNYGSLTYVLSSMFDKNIPFSEWEEYFKSNKYKSSKVFRDTQHPVVTSYK